VLDVVLNPWAQGLLASLAILVFLYFRYRKLRRLVDRLEEVTRVSEQRADLSLKSLEEGLEVVEQSKKRVETLERIKNEYFGVVRQMEEDRDRWKDMFFTQSHEHQNAQVMLEKATFRAYEVAHILLRDLNVYRKRDGKEPVKPTAMWIEQNREVSEAYGERMKKLADAAPESPTADELLESVDEELETDAKT